MRLCRLSSPRGAATVAPRASPSQLAAAPAACRWPPPPPHRRLSSRDSKPGVVPTAVGSAGRAGALAAAIRQIEASFGKGAVMMLGARGGPAAVDVISTGSLALDAALGVGGLPRGRVVEIYGPESSGKTTLALHVVAQAQARGLSACFIDAEHALDPAYARAVGVNLDALYLAQPDSGEQALEIADTLVRSGAMDVLVVDSVAALVPRAEIDGEMGDHHMALQARLMSQVRGVGWVGGWVGVGRGGWGLGGMGVVGIGWGGWAGERGVRGVLPAHSHRPAPPHPRPPSTHAGAAQADVLPVALTHAHHLHQPDPPKGGRHVWLARRDARRQRAQVLLEHPDGDPAHGAGACACVCARWAARKWGN